jgi:hypothetical protein
VKAVALHVEDHHVGGLLGERHLGGLLGRGAIFIDKLHFSM